MQKATEIGIDRIVVFMADHSVVRWDAPVAERKLRRLDRVAREAAMQSRRCWLPIVEAPGTFEDLAARSDAAIADRFADPVTDAVATVLIGPEGGWSDAERSAAGARVGLGPNVLRAETAAVAACALLAFWRR